MLLFSRTTALVAWTVSVMGTAASGMNHVFEEASTEPSVAARSELEPRKTAGQVQYPGDDDNCQFASQFWKQAECSHTFHDNPIIVKDTLEYTVQVKATGQTDSVKNAWCDRIVNNVKALCGNQVKSKTCYAQSNLGTYLHDPSGQNEVGYYPGLYMKFVYNWPWDENIKIEECTAEAIAAASCGEADEITFKNGDGMRCYGA